MSPGTRICIDTGASRDTGTMTGVNTEANRDTGTRRGVNIEASRGTGTRTGVNTEASLGTGTRTEGKARPNGRERYREQGGESTLSPTTEEIRRPEATKPGSTGKTTCTLDPEVPIAPQGPLREVEESAPQSPTSGDLIGLDLRSDLGLRIGIAARAHREGIVMETAATAPAAPSDHRIKVGVVHALVIRLQSNLSIAWTWTTKARKVRTAGRVEDKLNPLGPSPLVRTLIRPVSVPGRSPLPPRQPRQTGKRP